MTMLLFYIFGIIACFSGAMVILSKNPIHSVLFLILVFLNSTGFLILLEVEFLAMLVLVVYVGAIAILFLFVVMMLNVKVVDESVLRYLPIGGLITLFFCIETFLLLYGDLLSETTPAIVNWENELTSLTNIQLVGSLVYTHYSYLFILSGMVLLVAMIGAIVLTNHK